MAEPTKAPYKVVVATTGKGSKFSIEIVAVDNGKLDPEKVIVTLLEATRSFAMDVFGFKGQRVEKEPLHNES